MRVKAFLAAYAAVFCFSLGSAQAANLPHLKYKPGAAAPFRLAETPSYDRSLSTQPVGGWGATRVQTLMDETAIRPFHDFVKNQVVSQKFGNRMLDLLLDDPTAVLLGYEIADSVVSKTVGDGTFEFFQVYVQKIRYEECWNFTTGTVWCWRKVITRTRTIEKPVIQEKIVDRPVEKPVYVPYPVYKTRIETRVRTETQYVYRPNTPRSYVEQAVLYPDISPGWASTLLSAVDVYGRLRANLAYRPTRINIAPVQRVSVGGQRVNVGGQTNNNNQANNVNQNQNVDQNQVNNQKQKVAVDNSNSNTTDVNSTNDNNVASTNINPITNNQVTGKDNTVQNDTNTNAETDLPE